MLNTFETAKKTPNNKDLLILINVDSTLFSMWFLVLGNNSDIGELNTFTEIK